MSDGTATPLSSCGCCEAMPPLTAIANRPGLPALSYRIGTYGLFFQRMLEEIHAATLPDDPGKRPLATLTTRAPDDPVIALLDAWAVVADVLTFYQERIANEGYLRTAIERRSVLELARAIGYELSPGVAASAYLQFTVEALIGTAANAGAARAQGAAGPGSSAFNSGVVAVPQGTQVQSVPAPGQLPQTFETAADFVARVDWNSLMPRLSRPQDIALYGNQLYLLGATTGFAPGQYVYLRASQVYLLNPSTQLGASTYVPAVQVNQVFLQGTKTGLKSGDRLLLVGTRKSGTQTVVLTVRNVETDANLNTTAVEFVDNPTLPSFAPGTFASADLKLQGIRFTQANVNSYILGRSISEGDLQAFLKMNGWDAEDLATLVNNPPLPPASPNGLFAFGAKAAFVGNNAPPWKSLPKPSAALRADPYPLDWDTANDGAGRYIWTDSQGNENTDADVYLDRAYPQILANSWALLESPNVSAGAALQIVKVLEKSLADYGVSGRATGLTLQLPATSRGQNLGSPSAVSWAANRLDVFAIGFDGNLYHRWWDGSNWGGPENLGGGNLVNSPSAVSWSANRLDVFAIGTDGCLYHKWWDGSNWGPSGLENLGSANLSNSPSAVSWSANRLDVFAVGADGNLYHKYWDGNRWGPSGLENLGNGTLVNSPSAVSWAANRLDVFAISSQGDLLHKWWDGNNWGGQEDLGGDGNLINSPSVTAWAANRLDVFATGLDGILYHKWWDGNNWAPSDMENRGDGILVNSPSAVSWSANRLDVFGVGYTGNLRHWWWDGNSWGGPEDLGGDGNLINSPSAVSWASGRLDIFVTGASGHWRHKYWGGWWGGPEDLGNGSLAPFPVRTTTAFVQSQQLALAGVPVVDDIPAGTTDLMLNNLVLGLTPGQAVALNGVRADAAGVAVNEILTIRDITHVGGITTLSFVKGMQYSYLRASVTLSANVALGTHGATVQEVLGSGNGAQANQTFVLKRPPLTYVSAATPSGIASTLQIRVNGVAWQEAPTLYGFSPSDKEYVVRRADDGTPSVTFGDPAARLKTGQQNVSAVYRTGIGLAGNVAAGSLSLLQSRQPGLRGVTNPLPATGGADPQDLADARASAPLTVLTLDRIVSLDDYQGFAQAFPGVGKAQAIAVWSGTKRLIHITVGAADGETIDTSWPLFQTLVQAIGQAHDPVQNFAVAGYQALVFNLKAGLLIDQPTYDAKVVLAEVAAALADAFSFANRAFAQALTAAEIVTLMQAVPGVTAVYLTQLYLTSDPGGPAQTEPSPFLTALPARWQGGTIQPGQLLLLNPLGVTLTEVTS